ncbi:hypothetical protein MIB43_004275 [Providencia rettgeri]|uniref:hypothetical protein n=1 Tax=Providencia rettgeri TaxID=587 RepID=UPI001F034C48|nr:hypothetical protein [Providencia rettgeri]MCG9949134.1 hypothetical protein [Providencia rettgeri]
MDKSRREFEAWFSVNQNNHLDQLKRDQRGNYFYIVTRTAWDAWQASRESLINSLEPVGYIGAISLLRIRRNEKAYIYPDNNIKTIPLYRLNK